MGGTRAFSASFVGSVTLSNLTSEANPTPAIVYSTMVVLTLGPRLDYSNAQTVANNSKHHRRGQPSSCNAQPGFDGSMQVAEVICMSHTVDAEFPLLSFAACWP